MQPDSYSLFFNQAPDFVDRSLDLLGLQNLNELPQLSDDFATSVEPVLIRDFHNVTVEERSALVKSFYGRHGVASFIVINSESPAVLGHALIDLSHQLSEALPLSNPICHPAEMDTRAEELLGPPDGTLKVFQRTDQTNSLQSRELHMHQDGIGSGGTIVSIGLYCESEPLWGGFTCFQNALRLVLELARDDKEAFESLFHPSALTVLRRNGRNAIKVVGPVLYLDPLGGPQVFLRAPGGDYEMYWLETAALIRAREFLETYLKPFAQGTSFVQLSAPGQGCFVHNKFVLHGRTRFIDGNSQKRVLARKWFAATPEDVNVKRVPGLKILRECTGLCPELFGDEVLQGEWVYDDALGYNVRL